MNIVTFLLILALNTPAQVKTLRTAYFEAAADEKQMPALKNMLDRYPKQDHYFYCYLSAYYSLTSRYSKSLGEKMANFSACKKQLAQSFKLKDSFDARFIRFCIQHNTPGLLGYKSDLEQDKIFLLKHLKAEVNDEYKKNVKLFLKSCSSLSPAEKQQVENL